jgi:hypothetical protein
MDFHEKIAEIKSKQKKSNRKNKINRLLFLK